jgi:hypothetical protein
MVYLGKKGGDLSSCLIDDYRNRPNCDPVIERFAPEGGAKGEKRIDKAGFSGIL